MDKREQERLRPVQRKIGFAWAAFFFSPVLAGMWEARRLRWRQVLVGLSVLLNLVFIGAMVAVILDEKAEGDTEDKQLGDIVAPDCIECAPGVLQFCSPREASELARVEPNTIYVAMNGRPRARFVFEDDKLRAITEMSAFDEHGRSWLSVSFHPGAIIFDHYPEDWISKPDMSFIDKDADGIPDKKVDWISKKGFERVGDVVWRHIKKEDN